jgi:chromate transporter
MPAIASSGRARTPNPGVLALFARFLRFGLLAWGGPVAQIAMLRRELAEDERWIDGARFNRLLAIYQVLPGPEAHELAVHLGMLRAGRLGGLLAGLGFMLPGFLLVLVVAALYVSIDLHQPSLAAALLGIQVAVIGLVIRAVHRIGRQILVDPWSWGIAAGAVLATLARVPFWIVLPLCGLVYAVAPRVRGTGALAGAARTVIITCGLGAAVALVIAVAGEHAAVQPGVLPPAAGTPTEPTVGATFLSGLKAGLLTFGGAYTAIPFVRGDAVGSGWITDSQFLDALALAGVLPAPLIIFATFVGFLAGGPPGAVAMTLGIFLPAFAFPLLFGERLEAVVARPGLHRLLEGVAAGVVGIIAVTALDLATNLAGRVPNLAAAALILVVALVVLYRWSSRAAIPAVIAGGAALGWLAFDLFAA